MRYVWIEGHRDKFSVTRMCKQLEAAAPYIHARLSTIAGHVTGKIVHSVRDMSTDDILRSMAVLMSWGDVPADVAQLTDEQISQLSQRSAYNALNRLEHAGKVEHASNGCQPGSRSQVGRPTRATQMSSSNND